MGLYNHMCKEVVEITLGMNKWQSNFNKMIAIHDKIGFDLLLNEN